MMVYLVSDGKYSPRQSLEMSYLVDSKKERGDDWLIPQTSHVSQLIERSGLLALAHSVLVFQSDSVLVFQSEHPLLRPLDQSSMDELHRSKSKCQALQMLQ